MNKVYKIIQDRFIESLEAGEIPWNRPWSKAGQMPANAFTGRRYSGVNSLLLGMLRYEQPYWLTFNQAKKAGGNVKKGEKSTPVIYWKLMHFDKQSDKKLTKAEANKRPASQVKTVPLLRYYNVFNIDQCENLDPEKIHREELKTFEFNEIERAQSIADNMPNAPEIDHNGGGRATYSPLKDKIQLPKRERFSTPGGYYAILFHEMIHSTGHESRLNRDLSAGVMDKKSYSKEELIAEIGATFLSADAGILEQERFDNSAAYVNGWLRVFKREDNQTLIVHAAAAAQKAADYILDR